MKPVSNTLGSLFASSPAPQVVQPPAITSVPSVDLMRYAGKWYQIAAFPAFFYRDCLSDTTVEYKLTPEGQIALTHRCQTGNGFDEAHSSATVVAGSGNARLKVSFIWPFKTDCWIIGLDPDYRWCVVGSPKRDALWLFSRTPQLAPQLLDTALAIGCAQGFDMRQLRYTKHSLQA